MVVSLSYLKAEVSEDFVIALCQKHKTVIQLVVVRILHTKIALCVCLFRYIYTYITCMSKCT